MINKKNKILIMNIGATEDNVSLDALVKLAKEIYPKSDLCLATNQYNTNKNESIFKTHIYPKTSKNDIFIKRLFTELKFIFSIKKEKYKIAIIINKSNKNTIIAKYAKIKNIIGFEANDKKINSFLTHKILLNNKNNIENNIAEILQSLKVI